MARWRQAVELAMTDEDIEKLAAIARSRSEAVRRVERAQILLAYREKPSFFAVGQRLGLHHQTVQRWVRFICPKTRRNWLRLAIVRFHPGSSCPQRPP